jgi:hypothetical protein
MSDDPGRSDIVRDMPVTPLEINHWLIGAAVLLVFLALLIALLVFGAGREHS